MVNVQGAYCAVGDMKTGDLPAPSYMTKDQYVANAAEEIEIALGSVYVTPFEVDETPENRPTILFLKKVNWLLASARFIFDVAGVGEETVTNAYARQMLAEAFQMLKDAKSGELVLVGAEPLGDSAKNFTAPKVYNEDSVSLVEQFYTSHRPTILAPICYPPVTPYA